MSMTVQHPGFAQAAPKPPPLIEILHNLAAIAWRRRYLIAVPIVVLPILGAMIGSVVPLSYEAKMSILIQEPGKLNPFLEDLSVKTNLKDRMVALQALLTSRYVLASVAKDLGMMPANAPQEQQDRVVADLSSAVSVNLIGSEMVELTYKARKPKGMAEALTSIGERFMERVKAPEDSSIVESVNFLRGQLADSTAKLNSAEHALSDFRNRNADQLPDLRATNVQRLSQLRDQLAEREVMLAGATAELSSMNERLVQTDPVLGQIEQDIVSTRGELALLRARYTEAHSKVQAAARRLERLNDERAELLSHHVTQPADAGRVWNMASAQAARPDGVQPLLVSQATMLEQARIHVNQYTSEVANLRGAITALNARIGQSGEVARELADREREVQVQSDLVAQLRRRFDMAKVTGALSRYQAPQRIAVIDRPVEPKHPVKPMALLFTLGGLVAGIALGIGLAAIMELSDTTVRHIRMLHEATGLPVLARINALEPKWN